MVDHVSPTARALHTLDLLQRRPGIRAAQLARELGVSERAARRYIAILREADIAVDSTPGRYGGYVLGRGLRLPPLIFSGTEALALVMAALDGQHAVAGATPDPVGAALGKIVNALPREVGRQAALLREHAVAATERRTARPDPGLTSQLVEASAARRRVRIGYRSRSGSAFVVTVDPWAVVVRRGLWYLLCFARAADAVRTYRVDRITDLDPLEQSFVPPADLDAAALLEQQLGSDREFLTRVRFAAPLADVAPWVGAAMGTLEATGDESCLLRGSTSNPSMYAGEWLAAVPFRCTVEGGPQLRDAVAEVASRLRAALAVPNTAASETARPARRDG